MALSLLGAGLAAAVIASGSAPLAAPVSIGTVHQNSGVGTTLTKVVTANAAVGDLVFAFVSSGGSQSVSALPGGFTDTAGNTWQQATTASSSGGYRNRVYFTYLTAPLVSGVDSITATWGSATGYKQLHIFKASGLLGPTASTLDVVANGTTASGNPSFTTATLAQPRNLAVAFTFVIGGVGETITDNGSWQALADGAAGGVDSAAIHAAWYETAATTAVTHAPTLSNTTRETNSHIVVFKAT